MKLKTNIYPLVATETVLYAKLWYKHSCHIPMLFSFCAYLLTKLYVCFFAVIGYIITYIYSVQELQELYLLQQ